MFPKNKGFYPPKSSHFSRVFHYFHHPFWGPTPIFGNIHLMFLYLPGKSSNFIPIKILCGNLLTCVFSNNNTIKCHTVDEKHPANQLRWLISIGFYTPPGGKLRSQRTALVLVRHDHVKVLIQPIANWV